MLASHQHIVQGAPILIRATGVEGQCVWFNKRWLDFTGDAAETSIREGHWARVHPEDQSETVAAFDAAFQQRDSLQLEYRLRKRDESYCWVLDRLAPQFDDGGGFLGYVGFCIDVSQQYQFRERLEERERLLSQLYGINDRERRFLSCAIHDGILQDIIGAEMLLQKAEELEPADLEKKLAMVRRTLRSALRHGRRLISELRPLILDEQGLVSAIQFYAAEIENRSEIRFNIANSFDDNGLPPIWSGNVFRIVQSVMNNVESHSQAKEAKIEIATPDSNALRICVSDAGVGFEFDQKQNSFGLRCIRERAEVFDGTVTFESSPGNGCRAEMCIPLPIPESAS
jgi:PAS domain S-box-containing protein